jgi:UDP-glucose 4-epimerase
MATDPACAGEVINIGPDEEFVSVRELATLVARLLGVELRCEFLPPRPREVPLANCSAAKARALLGYRPRLSLEESLRPMVEWIRTRGPRPFRHHVDLEIVSEALPRTWSPGAT